VVQKLVNLGAAFLFVVEVKVSIGGLNHSPPLGIDSADTIANGMDMDNPWTIHTFSE
jgi:hypothetical protein